MTVIDYLPVGKEVWPNVLLSQTKKSVLSQRSRLALQPF